MLDEQQAQAVVGAITREKAAGNGRMSVERVEAALRPFSPVSIDTHERIRHLLHGADDGIDVILDVDPWFEADQVANALPHPQLEHRIRFLMMDTCACVLDHLGIAIDEARKRGAIVDPRIESLLNHEYLAKKA